MFLDEISIWISSLSKADSPPQCGWVSSNQSKAWTEEKCWVRRNSHSELGHELFPNFEFKLKHQLLLGLRPAGLQSGTIHHQPSWVSSWPLQTLWFVCLHNQTRQFLIINLSICLSICLPSIYLLLVLFLWRAQINTHFLSNITDNSLQASLRIPDSSPAHHCKGKSQAWLVGKTEDLATISDFRSPGFSDFGHPRDIYCLPWKFAVFELNLAARQEKEKNAAPWFEDWMMKRGSRTPQVKAGSCWVRVRVEFPCLKSPAGVIKSNEIMPFAPTWMDLEIVIPSEVSQAEKEKYHMASLTCGIEKEMIQVNLLIKQKETHRLKEPIYGCWGWRKNGGRNSQGVWDGLVHTGLFKMDNQ